MLISVTRSNWVSRGLRAGLAAACVAVSSLTVASAASAAATDDDVALARRYAPRVWLAQGESYFPSSVEWHLNQTHVENRSGQQFLVTNQALGCDSCTEPSFLDGQRPGQHDVPVYAEVAHRTDAGRPTNVTDIMYWMFYPYNNGKRVCIGLYIPVIGCAGGYSTFGNHVGDWERVTLRLVDGRPYQISLSQHSGGQTFRYGDPAVALDGERPVVYAARGSHGLYPDARRHTYKNLPNGDTLNDDTSAGTAWDTRTALKAFTWQPDGSYTGEWAWLNYTGRWGNPKSGCHIVESISGECVLNDGPTGLPTRSVHDPGMQSLDGTLDLVPGAVTADPSDGSKIRKEKTAMTAVESVNAAGL